MFRRRLTVALLFLAAAAVLEGFVAVWALSVAERHVQRGRVASDIQLGFVESFRCDPFKMGNGMGEQLRKIDEAFYYRFWRLHMERERVRLFDRSARAALHAA